MKTKKSMRQICPKCGYEKCVPKLYIDNPKYPSGSILRCKQCKSLFRLKMEDGSFGRNGNKLTRTVSLFKHKKQPIICVWLLYTMIREKCSILTCDCNGTMFLSFNVEGQEHIPIEVANLAAFLFYRYKFLSRAKDKNLYRLPEWTRT
ncbi:hypothetical protein CQ043_10570 [Paenibacillus sp. MYb63]|uniref:Uncharacterized protein n=1 Tax=Paenibacillus amylolyticus TaxID=1451 RepID=A0A1R1BF09_PAEAM|nr:hypothetical protein BK131_29180 [Paenibacillus amylolyticus]PRA07793.1 hypothetical protein CQ043_10570 [Paenibacillus sp. MYb63]PRA51437.1 hypothetical protein CQ061_03725 [Paenibacillus sp. MYb67]